MRSEREAGPGLARGGGREKRPMETPLRRESPRREPETPPPAPGPPHPGLGRQREEKRAALSKVVIRRLPPCLTKEQLEEQLHPLPAHDYFEFCTADPSLYPHLYSRAYINFRNPDDILLFRDRFDGYVFIDNKGLQKSLEYPAVVEFAPFQKISKKKLKKKDAKAGSIEDDPEYRKFLESYCADEEKICANPEILLGEIEAKTRELIARRTTPLLEYIKNRKLEKQRIREEKREERRRRELEKKRLREEEKRKRREEERRKRKEAEKQKKIAEKEIRIKLLKKPEKGDDLIGEMNKEKGEEADIEESKWEKSPGSGSIKPKPLEGSPKEPKEKSQNDSDKEQMDLERRFREKELERQRYRLDDGRKHRAHYEFDKFMRRNEEELKWGKGYSQERGKKGNHNYSFTVEAVDKLGKEDKCDDMASKKERIRNKDRPAMQLYQPGARIRTHTGSTSKISDCPGKSSEDACDRKYEPPPPPPLEGPRPPRGLPARRTPARTERESRAAPRARFRLVLRLQATDTLHRTTAGKHKAGIEAAFQPPDLSPQPILIALVARKTNTNSCRTSLCYRIATLQDNVNNLNLLFEICSAVQAATYHRKMEMFQILRKTSERLECDHCSFRGTDYENIQIHMGTIHPEYCDEMDAAGLGKLIFYQKSAKLFHCHKCFFTSKMYCNVYYHITSQHAVPEKWNEDQKDQLEAETESLKTALIQEPQKHALSPESHKPALSPELPKPDPVISPKLQKPSVSPELEKPASVGSPEPEKLAPAVSPEPQKPALAVSPDSIRHSSAVSPEPQKPAPAVSPEPQKPAPAVSPEPQKPAPAVSPEPQKPAPAVSPEPRRRSPAVSPEPRKRSPAVFPEPQKPAPAVSPEPRRRSPAVSPEPRRRSPAVSPEPRRHMTQTRRPAPALSPEPRRPASTISPEAWRPAPSVSPESWRPATAISHELQKSAAAAASPWPQKPAPVVTPEPRRPAPVVSPEPRRPAPDPWKPTSFSDSQKSVSSEPWKPISSVYPEGWKPVLSPDTWMPAPPVSPELRKPSHIVSSEVWKSSLFSDLRKPAPSLSPEPWKLSSESRKSTFFSETQKSAPSISPEGQKRSLFPESRKRALFSEPRKSASAASSEVQKRAFFPEPQISALPVSPEVQKNAPFTESQKPVPFSPEVQKHAFFPEPQKLDAASPEVQEHTCLPEPQKVSPASSPEIQKPVPFAESQKPASTVSPEVQKYALFTESQKPAPAVSPETHKQAFFPEPQKCGISPDVQKHTLFSEIQKPPAVSSDVQKHALSTDPHKPAPSVPSEVQKNVLFPEPLKPTPAVSSELQTSIESNESGFLAQSLEDQKTLDDLLSQEEQSILVKEPSEEIYSCPKKKPKKENQENSDNELNNSECGKTEMDSVEVKEQESNSDQEQFDMEPSDYNKESKVDTTTPIQPQCVLQFTEEKEAFISEEEIAKYMKRGKGKYYCKICCCRAMKKGAVLHHLVNKHNVQSPYKCKICGKAFLLESLLKNHVAAHGQSLLKCPRCNFESNFPRGFKKHLTHCQSRHSEDANKKHLDSLEPSEQM